MNLDKLFIKGFFDMPTSAYSTSKRLIVHSAPARPLGHSEGFAVNSKVFIGGSIVGLFSMRSPLAIFGTIITVVIDSFESFSGWLITHVFVKSFKRIEPASTNLYSTTAISFIVTSIRIRCTSLNCSPGSIFWRFYHAVFCNFLFMHTATALRFATIKTSTSYKANVAAITEAFPDFVACFRVLWNQRQHYQFIETLIDLY
ncbi:hypothetical protein LCGC14_3076450, partial [marine sediment metagenome]